MRGPLLKDVLEVSGALENLYAHSEKCLVLVLTFEEAFRKE